MPTTYEVYCRPCHVPLKVISEESGDSMCPRCGFRFIGDVLRKVVEEELRRDRLNAEAERRGLFLGERGEVTMLPSKIPGNIRDRLLVLRIPD